MTFLADKFLASYMKAADAAYESVMSWSGGNFSADGGGGSVRITEIVFKEGSGPSYRILEMVLQHSGSTTAMFQIDGVDGGAAVPSARGAVVARGAVNIWAALGAKGAADNFLSCLHSAVRDGMDRSDLEDVWNEAVVRNVLSA